MLTVCLATIPSRFDQLGGVLQSLLAQTVVPNQIILSWCRTYLRFPGSFQAPLVPEGVTLFETSDIGPLTKLAPLPGLTGDVVWCDDDCLYGPGWLASLGEGLAAASTFPVRRLGCDCDDLVGQGFAGVRAPAAILKGVLDMSDPARWADDIWISGHLAAQGAVIQNAPQARAEVTPLGRPDALQDDTPRSKANLDAVQAVRERYGIWPAVRSQI